jgi:hypothetical protein
VHSRVRSLATAASHESLTFAAVSRQRRGHGFASITAIDQFINHIDRWRHVTGLEPIADGNVTPHMFRRILSA